MARAVCSIRRRDHTTHARRTDESERAEVEDQAELLSISRHGQGRGDLVDNRRRLSFEV